MTELERKVKTPSVGMRFSSYIDLDNYLDEYMNDVNQRFIKAKSTPSGPKCKIKKILKDGIDYHEINFVCKHGKRKHRPIQTLRKKRSLKMGCEARIRVQASSNGNWLKITHVVLKHTGHLDTKLDPVPECRRLSPAAYKFALEASELKCSRPRLIAKLKEKFGITVTTKDLKNILSKWNKKIVDEVAAVIEFLKRKGARVDVLIEEKIFQGLFFTTPDMLISAIAWAEVVYFDGTYKLMSNNLIMIVFLVEDGNYLTDVIGIAIVRREDQATLDWVFQCFKKHHEHAVHKIRYFMCDKNVTQRNSIKEFFPDSTILMCLYHTLQIFTREIGKLQIEPAKKKAKCLRLLKKIAKVENDLEYNKLFNKIQKTFPDCALKYFLKNWHEIKYEWTCHAQHKGSFGNKTNNRCESTNQKLKSVIMKLTSLLKAIKDFFIWKDFHDGNNNMKIAKTFSSELPRVMSTVEQDYVNLLMQKPFETVQERLGSTEFVEFDSMDSKNEVFVIESTARITTVDTCNCVYAFSYCLPCEHIFVVREIKCLPLFDENLCAERWTQKFCKKSHRMFNSNCLSQAEYPLIIDEKKYDRRSKKQIRLMQLNEVINDLTDAGSTACGDRFLKKLTCMYELLEKWEKKCTVTVVVDDRAQEDIQIDRIVHQLQNLHFFNNVESIKKLDVPQKRKRLSKLTTLFVNLAADQQKVYESKLKTLDNIRDAWFDGQDVILSELTHQITVQKCLENEKNFIELPKNKKVAGRPKNALITNNMYNKKKS